MSRLDRALLAEKAAAIERHLDRVRQRLPGDAEELLPMTDASDAIILHLWQSVQSVIDLAGSACLHFHLGTPQSYGEAFQRLADAGFLKPELAGRLTQAVGFRNVIAHAYDKLDMNRVYRAAREGPADLRAFLAALAERLP
ncbi:MAG TPA: DUF86 domain-containing protein [Thermoanaerobaculia bacterium]|jgi:uncharacterized protein YutE (UPF0331/DUF86 family)|nr:DUF86 domain-containing protein [Thermoanaerobaculia bacterium]